MRERIWRRTSERIKERRGVIKKRKIDYNERKPVRRVFFLYPGLARLSYVKITAN